MKHTYKGFDKNLQCRGVQYEVGKEYKVDGKISCCKNGFHSCEMPLDVFTFYPPNDSRYCETEPSGELDKESNVKIASSYIKIIAEIGLKGLVDSAIKFLFEKIKVNESTNVTTGNSAHSATTGNSAHSATTGNSAHSATTGYSAHSATTGDYAHSATTGNSAHSATTGNSAHSATTGYYAHSATTGYSAHSATTGNSAHSATTGDSAHSATTGDYAHSATTGYSAHSATTGNSAHSATTGNSAHSATTGYSAHSATTGYYAHSVTTGNSAHSVVNGKESIACGLGIENKAKGVLGSWLVISEWQQDNNYNWYIKSIKSVKVDGKKIKENTWYILKNGRFVKQKLIKKL
jgi:hypothetical protein